MPNGTYIVITPAREGEPAMALPASELHQASIQSPTDVSPSAVDPLEIKPSPPVHDAFAISTKPTNWCVGSGWR
ncbi:hypothetical protein HY948_02000 [Candidatus Gottesmanbacteria bacterium]|nr:hypothetical protein [Candidatus Gottesmanbacteria bacterium]